MTPDATWLMDINKDLSGNTDHGYLHGLQCRKHRTWTSTVSVAAIGTNPDITLRSSTDINCKYVSSILAVISLLTS